MNREFFNDRLYLSMAAHFESLNTQGAAQCMAAQAQEETEHPMRLYNHLGERGVRTLLGSLQSPPT